jgi:hypothetical protein
MTLLKVIKIFIEVVQTIKRKRISRIINKTHNKTSIELFTDKAGNKITTSKERKIAFGTKSLFKRILINRYRNHSKLNYKNYLSLLFLSLYRKGPNNSNSNDSY